MTATTDRIPKSSRDAEKHRRALGPLSARASTLRSMAPTPIVTLTLLASSSAAASMRPLHARPATAAAVGPRARAPHMGGVENFVASEELVEAFGLGGLVGSPILGAALVLVGGCTLSAGLPNLSHSVALL